MDQSEYFRSHPPRCINGFVLQPTKMPNVTFDGHGEALNPVFCLNCSCGHTRHFILGHYWRNPAYKNTLLFAGPLALRCEACETVTELYDSNDHGYDPELGHGSSNYCGEGQRNEFRCEACGVQPFEVYTRFEYPEDLFDGDYEDFNGRQQDLFSWFSVIGTCSDCSQLREVTDFECS